MKELFTDYIQYNEWANKQLIDFLRQEKEIKLEEEAKNSFTTLRSTILHIWDAQEIWLNRLKGKSMTFFPSTKFKGTTQDALLILEKHSAEFVTFVQQMNANSFENYCTYQNTNGQEFRQLVREIILHAMNHSTYHRGQIITICYQLGIKGMPSTDYMFYLRQKNKAT